MSSSTVSPSSPSSRPLLMIPGPTEYDARVLAKLGEPSLSHVSPVFISEFGECIELFRKVLLTSHGQPVILSGSGTIGWDMIVANILEKGERVLVVNTGYFSDSFVACAEAYDIHVDQLKADIGHTILAQTLSEEIKHATAAGKHYSMVFLTQVDTSTGVLNDIHALAKAVKSVSPSTLIAVDGVCSFGSEEFRFDDWGIDGAMTFSQKGLGFPPGLSLIAFSPAALLKYQSRKTKVPAYFIDLKNWLPIMNAYEKRTPSYFATPNVNLIRAARIALKLLIEEAGGMEKVFQIHQQTAHRFRRALHALQLNVLPTDAKHAANTLSAIWYPEDIDKSKLLSALLKNGIVAAGGLHKDCKANYFRIGHMGVSVLQNNAEMIKKTLEALEASLIEVGHKCEKGAALKAFNHA